MVSNENTKNLKIIIKLVLFCARQGIAFRGHDETNESSNKGNFIELIELVSSFIQSLFDFTSRDKTATYISKTIQNEIIDLLAKEVRVTISLEIKSNIFFALIVDETTDISTNEQFTFCVRYVDENFKIFERFFRFWRLEKTDAQTILELVKNILKELGLDINNISGIYIYIG